MTPGSPGHVQLTSRQLEVLKSLLDGPKTTTDLSKDTGISAPQLYSILDIWKKRGLVEKVPQFIGKGVTGYRYLWSINRRTLRFQHPSFDAEITITFPKD